MPGSTYYLPTHCLASVGRCTRSFPELFPLGSWSGLLCPWLCFWESSASFPSPWGKFNQGHRSLLSLPRQWILSESCFVLLNGRKSALFFHTWASLTQALSQELWWSCTVISRTFCLFFPGMMMRSRPVSMKRLVRISGSLRCLSGATVGIWCYFTPFQVCYSLRTSTTLPETSSQKYFCDKTFWRAKVRKPQFTI